ncbi:RHS repeat-associated core domain-containing protein [Stieleria varia]|uniref:tRNA3(Ser)-specific nuclease WapA n=1 Tax=Stieleria varia TaxID=2528005 RepID=A0A5C5ZLM4_9BACT|nr:RHS repeat-associated core domain-containing protein [Stieleria varia]TWT88075.1 tRNA3(Ser)-specific nuclease WapA precursor [Stieleria varia]
MTEDGTSLSADPNTETWSLKSETSFLADHHNYTGYTQTIRETTYDDQGNVVKTIDYTFGHDEIAQRVVDTNDQGQVTNDQLHIFGHDGHGSVRVLYDASAAIAQVFTFAAYGEMIALHNATAQSIAVANRLSSLGYSGEHFDAKAGQQYLRARFYNPANGQFNRLDAFTGNRQDPQSFNKYSYVHGDPIAGIDPSGLMAGGAGGTRTMTITIGIAVALTAFAIPLMVWYNNQDPGMAGIDQKTKSAELKLRMINDENVLESDRKKAIKLLDSRINEIRGGSRRAQDRFYKYFGTGDRQVVLTNLTHSRDYLESITFINNRGNTWDYGYSFLAKSEQERRDMGAGLYSPTGIVIAFVIPTDNLQKIYFNDNAYFDLSGDNAGSKTRIGTLIHEASHEAAHTKDEPFDKFRGASRDQAMVLKDSDPHAATNNAYVLEYYTVPSWEEVNSQF